jgi:NAD(P)-dependent dehydrogenase (short-subunit alcohol dehydrogenase family)
MKSIVITGVSTGIGYGAAKGFIRKGYQVFGSVRKKEDADRLKKEFGDNFIPLIFDITDHTAIAQAAKFVKENLGNSGLAGLINNAGAAEGAPIMHMTIDSFRNHLEVLLIGHLVVIQEFLPLLGAQKDYPYMPGKIINITSTNGKVAVPFLAGYVAAKHTFDGFSNTLRMELLIYGIDVIIVAPGRVKTAIWDKTPKENAEKFRNTDYYRPAKKLNDFLKESLPIEALEIDEVCKKVIKIFELKRPRTRYAIVRNKFKSCILPRILPVRMSDKVIARFLGLQKPNSSLSKTNYNY